MPPAPPDAVRGRPCSSRPGGRPRLGGDSSPWGPVSFDAHARWYPRDQPRHRGLRRLALPARRAGDWPVTPCRRWRVETVAPGQDALAEVAWVPVLRFWTPRRDISIARDPRRGRGPAPDLPARPRRGLRPGAALGAAWRSSRARRRDGVTFRELERAVEDVAAGPRAAAGRRGRAGSRALTVDGRSLFGARAPHGPGRLAPAGPDARLGPVERRSRVRSAAGLDAHGGRRRHARPGGPSAGRAAGQGPRLSLGGRLRGHHVPDLLHRGRRQRHHDAEARPAWRPPDDGSPRPTSRSSTTRVRRPMTPPTTPSGLVFTFDPEPPQGARPGRYRYREPG